MRMRHKLIQTELTKRVQPSQARVARIEGAEASVTSDLMLQSLIAAGANRKKLIGLCKFKVRRGGVTHIAC